MFLLSNEVVINHFNSTNLEYIEIIGLFGRTNVKIEFNKEVNIFIGENGMGKTTILNCVYYILNKQYDKLATIDFNTINIKFKNKEVCVINMTHIKLYNERDRSPFIKDKIQMLEMAIEDFIPDNPINISSLELDTIAKDIADIMDYPMPIVRMAIQDYITTKRKNINTSSSKKDCEKIDNFNIELENNITESIHYFTTYRRIENEFSNLMHKKTNFDNAESLINFGMSDVENSIKTILELIGKNSRESFNKMTSVLLKQYSSIGDEGNANLKNELSLEKDTLKIIFDRLGDEIEQEDKNKIFSLVDNGKIKEKQYSYLLNFIHKLVDSYDKQKIYDDKIIKFAETCNKYLNGKKFIYNQNQLTLKVYLTNDGGKDNNYSHTLYLSQLSSGEKQIVSLFSKLYLENEGKCILIIDEPELSISIMWQKMLIPDIMRSNNCNLLLTVTHSPFIFDNEFDMEAKELRACTTPYEGGVTE